MTPVEESNFGIALPRYIETIRSIEVRASLRVLCRVSSLTALQRSTNLGSSSATYFSLFVSVYSKGCSRADMADAPQPELSSDRDASTEGRALHDQDDTLLDLNWSLHAAEIPPGELSQMCPSAPRRIQSLGYDPSVTAYRPLSNREIRVVQLVGAESDKPLLLEIEHVNLDLPDSQREKYAGLSYSWEGQKRNVAVQLWTSDWTPFTVNITKSLLNFLLKVRPRQRSKRLYVWVDQLSINQADDKEKASQIGLMGDIFSKACFVHVWIGEESSDSDLAFRRIQEILDILHDRNRKEQPTILVVNKTPCLHPDFVRLCVGPDTDSNNRSWRAIANLSKRPWFSRLWVVQEATALEPRKVWVHCGKKHSELLFFSPLMALLLMEWIDAWKKGISDILDFRSIAADLIDFITYLMCFRAVDGSSDRPKQRLTHLLNSRAAMRTTDDRDLLFCMLHTSIDVPRNEGYLQVDYSQSFAEVCYRYVLWHVATYHNLDFLGHCQRQWLPGTRQWPTWIPEWSQRKQPNSRRADPISSTPHIGIDDEEPIWINASGHFVDSITIVSDLLPQLPRFLALSGIRVGRVAASFPQTKVLDPSWTQALHQKICTVNHTSMLEAFLQTAAEDDKPVSIETVHDL